MQQQQQKKLSPIALAFSRATSSNRDVFCRSEEYEDQHRCTKYGYTNQDPNDA